MDLGDALKTNTTLEVINLETNWLDHDGVQSIGEALTENLEASVHTLKLSNQCKTSNFGRAAEEALAVMLEKNDKITKLGFSPNDPHWKSQVSRWFTRNT